MESVPILQGLDASNRIIRQSKTPPKDQFFLKTTVANELFRDDPLALDGCHDRTNNGHQSERTLGQLRLGQMVRGDYRRVCGFLFIAELR
jgi:hypothetical protein